MALASLESISDSSRVWIYRADRKLNKEEEKKVNQWLDQFVMNWTAHSHSLQALGKVYHSQFIVVFLDEESSAQASGCSIDSQVRFIKEIGASLQIDFFNRVHFDFLKEDQIVTFHQNEVKNQIEEKVLDEDSLVLDHLVKNKQQFDTSWAKPLKSSWHFRLI